MVEMKSLVLGLVGGGLAALGLGLWARTRLQALAEQLRHSEQSRQQEMQFTSAARRQIEALQNELAELRQLLARRGVTPPPRQARVDLPVESDAPAAPEPAADGFQATQIVPRSRA